MSILIALSRENNLFTPVLSARRDCHSPHFYGLGSWAGYAPISYVMNTGLAAINPAHFIAFDELASLD